MHGNRWVEGFDVLAGGLCFGLANIVGGVEDLAL
jgi:hypothetical protein